MSCSVGHTHSACPGSIIVPQDLLSTLNILFASFYNSWAKLQFSLTASHTLCCGRVILGRKHHGVATTTSPVRLRRGDGLTASVGGSGQGKRALLRARSPIPHGHLIIGDERHARVGRTNLMHRAPAVHSGEMARLQGAFRLPDPLGGPVDITGFLKGSVHGLADPLCITFERAIHNQVRLGRAGAGGCSSEFLGKKEGAVGIPRAFRGAWRHHEWPG